MSGESWEPRLGDWVTCLSTGRAFQLVVLDSYDRATPWGAHSCQASREVWEHDPGFAGGRRPILTWQGKPWAGVTWYRRGGFRQATQAEIHQAQLAQLAGGGL